MPHVIHMGARFTVWQNEQLSLRPHFAKNERLSGAKTVPERVHWGTIEGVSIVSHLCGGAVGVLTCPVVWVGDYRDPFFVYFFP